jgi:hypothetical protein
MPEDDKTGLIYFKDGKLIAESGTARIYSMNNELFLEIGHDCHSLWALESELPDYIWQLKDYPKGSCLEIGLGLGVASKYILTFPKVEKLTTVEKNESVIEVQKKANPIDDDRHLVLNADGLIYAYETKRMFDFIFIDCYSHIDEDTLPLIADMAYACKRILKDDGRVVGWWDESTPEGFVDTFFSLFK